MGLAMYAPATALEGGRQFIVLFAYCVAYSQIPKLDN